MTANQKYTGFAIALAWPQTYCKQPGAWYDPITLALGFSTNHYYRVGHAAVVLVDTDNRKCHYFDFGRYHAPFQHGRVRGAETDHELGMNCIARISGDSKSILNFREIVSELRQNKACHGEGELHASYCKVDFQASFDKAMQMQHAGPIPYGPFLPRGSNCSRFVNKTIRAGNPHWKSRFRLKYLVPFTPTPMNNVNSLEHNLVMTDHLNETPFCPTKKPDPKLLNSTLQAPPRKTGIPKHAQWLSGEGAGSWFVYEVQNSHLKLTRYSPEAVVECAGLYKNENGQQLSGDDSFRITYPSNCNEVFLKNKETVLRFKRVMDNFQSPTGSFSKSDFSTHPAFISSPAM